MTTLKKYQMYVDGEWIDAENGVKFESVNPATGEAWAEIPSASEADVDRAVKAAHRAFTEGPWSTMLPTERGVLLRNLAEVMKEHSEELGKTETTDTGKLLSETRWQAAYLSTYYHYYAGLADKIIVEHHYRRRNRERKAVDLAAGTTHRHHGIIQSVL